MRAGCSFTKAAAWAIWSHERGFFPDEVIGREDGHDGVGRTTADPVHGQEHPGGGSAVHRLEEHRRAVTGHRRRQVPRMRLGADDDRALGRDGASRSIQGLLKKGARARQRHVLLRALVTADDSRQRPKANAFSAGEDQSPQIAGSRLVRFALEGLACSQDRHARGGCNADATDDRVDPREFSPFSAPLFPRLPSEISYARDNVSRWRHRDGANASATAPRSRSARSYLSSSDSRRWTPCGAGSPGALRTHFRSLSYVIPWIGQRITRTSDPLAGGRGSGSVRGPVTTARLRGRRRRISRRHGPCTHAVSCDATVHRPTPCHWLESPSVRAPRHNPAAGRSSDPGPRHKSG